MDIDSLAALARISVPDSDKVKVAQDLEKILSYVSELESVKGLSSETIPTVAKDELRNVFRKDEKPYEPREYTKAILAEAPRIEEGYLVVKKILDK